MVTVHHLGSEPVSVRLDLGEADPVERLVDLFGGHDLEPGPGGRVELELEPYAHRWWRVRRPR